MVNRAEPGCMPPPPPETTAPSRCRTHGLKKMEPEREITASRGRPRGTTWQMHVVEDESEAMQTATAYNISRHVTRVNTERLHLLSSFSSPLLPSPAHENKIVNLNNKVTVRQAYCFP